MTQLSTHEGTNASTATGFARITERINALSFAQKAMAIIGAVALIAGGAALYYFSTSERMAPVYSNLDPADASAIVEQLSADGVNYELTGGGTTVLVPESQVDSARLRAAGEGLPGNTRGGYGLLDDMGVTASDFQQTVTYKRAIEGELAGTIEALDAVDTASVSLSIPEETVFTDEAEEPTASVFISSRPGSDFTDEQVYSISHIVAAAVDGLDPTNVSIVDSAGTLLAGMGADAAGGASGAAADYEERVTGSVTAMLDTVVGRGNSTVTVNADVSQESSELLEETFADSEAGPLTEITNIEEYIGAGAGGAGGVLGPDNIAVPNGADGESTYTSEQNELQNAVNKVTQTTNIPAGALDRQTISVAIDEEAAAGMDAELLTAMVTDAVGLDEERGDALSVSLVPFSVADAEAAEAALAEAEAEAAAAAAAEAEMQRNIIMAVAAVALLIVIALIVGLLMKKRRKDAETEYEDLGESFTSLPPSNTPAPTLLDTTDDTTDLLPVARSLSPAEPTPSAQRRAELNALATEDPAQMADHLRTLMDQEEVKL